MLLGGYELGEYIGSNQICSRYWAKSTSSTQHVELRPLHVNMRIDRSQLELQLRKVALIDCPYTRRLQAFDLTEKVGYVILPTVETFLTDLVVNSGEPVVRDPLRFVIEITRGLLAAHHIGVVVGPLDVEVISRAVDGVWLLDCTAWLTHLANLGVADNQSQPATFRFAAPETLEQGICDSLSDLYSWGQLIRWILGSNFVNTQDTMVISELRELASTLCAADPTERATLSEFLASVERSKGAKLGSGTQDSSLATQAIDILPQTGSDQTSHIAFGSVAFNSDTQDIEATAATEFTSFTVPTPQVAARIGRFEIHEKLGEGGMGTVYKAYDLADGSQVALKILNSRLLGNVKATRRFAKEARLLAQARSPYVANLLETNSENGCTYLAVEFVSGGSLGSVLSSGEQLDLQFALTVLIDTARGLTLAHDRGIVHRDIKPDNILLTDVGRSWLEQLRKSGTSVDELKASEPQANDIVAKLADFGIARLEHQSESLALTGDNALLGTPLYMAPEQCLGARVDARADIYSLGITLYRMLAGQTPFQGDSSVALMTMHANDTPPAIKGFRSDLPEAIGLVIDKCLAKNPDARYGHGRELLLDLENLVRGQPTSIGLHPPLIASTGADVLTFEHAWELSSAPEELWPYISHTDRVNHAMGLTSVEYVVTNDPIHGAERMAEAVIAGQRIRWREHPYEWVEGKRLSVLREFTQGPFEWFINVVELHRLPGGGTRIVQTLKVVPRGWLGKALAKIQLGAKSYRSFGQVYKQIDHYLQQQAAKALSDAGQDPWGSGHEMNASQRSRLLQRLEVVANRGAEPAALNLLQQLLEHGSELEVARIRPFALADLWNVDRARMLEACLLGAHEGMLLLLWDILCPTCRIPSGVVDTLASLKDHAHCEACNVQFELDFGKSIELIFRVHPELRKAETKTYCIGGPAWSRHVVAQVRLARGERFACDLALEPGSYTVRGPQLPFTLPFRVMPSAKESMWEVGLAAAPNSKQPMELRASQQAIWLWNDTERDLEIRIERMASRNDAVTATAATSTSLFRELFGDQVLSTGQLISVAHITLLMIKLFGTGERYRQLGDAPAFSQIRQQLEENHQLIKRRGGATIKTIGETVVAVFTEPLAAFQCAVELCKAETDYARGLDRSAVIHCGPAVVTTLDDRLDYFGQMVHDALSHLDLTRPGTLLSSAALTSHPEIKRILAQSNFALSAVDRADAPLVLASLAET